MPGLIEDALPARALRAGPGLPAGAQWREAPGPRPAEPGQVGPGAVPRASRSSSRGKSQAPTGLEETIPAGTGDAAELLGSEPPAPARPLKRETAGAFQRWEAQKRPAAGERRPAAAERQVASAIGSRGAFASGLRTFGGSSRQGVGPRARAPKLKGVLGISCAS